MKIDLTKPVNTAALSAKLLCMLKNLPDILSGTYEERARQLVRENFSHPHIESVENDFILFSLGKESKLGNAIK